MIKKRLFVISNDHKQFTSKFEVTDESIDSISIAERKTINIIDSCIYSEQLDVAQKYVDLLYEMYPYSTIVNRMRISDIRNIRMGNKKHNIEPLTSILDRHEIDLSKKNNKAIVQYLEFLKNYNHELNVR